MNIFKKPAARFLAKRSALGLPAGFATIKIPQLWALNSAVECHLHTVEVTGSNPVAPTIIFCHLQPKVLWRLCTLTHIKRQPPWLPREFLPDAPSPPLCLAPGGRHP